MMKTRKYLGQLLQTVLKTGVGCEVGVQNGYFSRTLFEYWQGQIICVDIWPDNNILGNCVKTLNGKNYKLMVGPSVATASLIEDNSLDFVYLDAGHSLEDIRSDWAAWYPKVRPGGIVAGHDYGHNGFGVKTFIDDLQNKGMQFGFTTDDFWEGIEYQSFWHYKPE